MAPIEDAPHLNAQYPGGTSRPGARLLALIAAVYLTFGLFSRLIEDSFQAAGLTSFEESGTPLFLVVIATLASLLLSLAISGTQLSLVARLIFKRTTRLSALRSIELIMIESLRAVAATALRLPLLILPAIYEWVRLTPVPMIVLLDEAYARGERDILEASRAFFKEHRTLVFGLVIVSLFFFTLEFSLSSAPADSLPIWQAPLQHMGSIAVIALAHFATDIFVVAMYTRAVDRSRKTKVS